ncbi:glycolate oxidase subunit GlcE [Janthinobacterium sp. BJB1]|uniref:glycolate oxidase subunit GlcE n=1 Tax=Janthinobacterium sp. GW458P TaxID=1981504 RepID=UPI000A31F6F0|nr:glycolate oxidase subunit GlcE [Janthinobacterium sp. GW458P]MBE3027214.1 glycolate oxidase subunit GlcE [Janthinobacterium sp. GW458P]PHV15421.1 glycolate oxidase subunit GlcE [Janthinobacterium sp. BJB303]PJC97565.1 glycolate oxidase subunit GlcE [Janthinobacterium sp. BJB1]
MQAIVEQFRQQILAAGAAGKPLRLRGGGTKDWYGQRLDGEVLDTRAYAGIIDYEPTELVITARCGTPLAEIEAALAARQQMLAFEPPHFGPGATIGGVVASALSGPRRASAGALRDFVLGAVLLDGRGERLAFGGQVMKNVAGYDVSRLLAGSMGTLGLILEVSLKVLPLPLREATLRVACAEIAALRLLNEWAGKPLPISASCWHDGVLSVRLSGAEAAVSAALQSLGGELLAPDDAAAFWLSLREQTHAFFAGAGSLWRLSLPPHASAIILQGRQLIEWGGAQRWLKLDGDADAAGGQRIRQAVAAAGGHATLFRGGDKAVGVFHPLAPAVAAIHQRLRQAFDPAGIFNPHRMT